MMSLHKTFKSIIPMSIVIVLSIFLLANSDGTRYILWDANNKLTWDDFKDTALTNSYRAAATDAGIKVSFAQTGPGSLTITAFSAMYPAYSWVDSTKKSPYILSHEQYHFNITEYWCRKLKKDLATARFTLKNVKDKAADIQKEDFKNCHEMQVQYDAETDHSRVKEEQKKWQEKIDGLLKSVEEYSANTVEVKLR